MTEYSIENGVARWNSNNRCVPIDCLEKYNIPVNPFVQKIAIDKETNEFLAEYRKNPPVYDEETLCEMRATFGPGATVVNVITGKKIKL